MKSFLNNLRFKLRLLWYRRNYYWSRVWPNPVPFNPLPYLPPGFTISSVANTGLRVVDNFVTPEEAAYLIHVARKHLARSQVVIDGNPVLESGRTSSHTVVFHRYKQDPRVLPIIARGAMLAGVPAQNAEQIYVSRYGPGEFYHGHYDVAGDFLTAHRLCTMLVYLNDLTPEQGGATYFRDLKVAVQPVAGRAVCWTNTNPDGSTHAETLHAALPPTGEDTEKWVIQLWFRPYKMHKLHNPLQPLQASEGKPITADDSLPEGAWLVEPSAAPGGAQL